MENIIDQIDNREVFVRVIRRSEATPVKEQDKLAAKLIELARVGQRVLQEIENCNRNVLACSVKKCPGRNYCRTYHEPKVKRQIILPEPPKSTGV